MNASARREVNVCTDLSYLVNVSTSAATVTLPKHLKRLRGRDDRDHSRGRRRIQNPVMLYSIGKDSSVMLHLAIKTGCRRSNRRHVFAAGVDKL